VPEPAIDVLGVYRLDVSDDLFKEQLSILYPEDLPDVDRVAAEGEIREQLESVVLIEANVRNRDARFDPGDFIQPRDDFPRDNWQVAWAEAYLSLDGHTLAVKRWSGAPESGDVRIAFFVHYWDPLRPLLSSYGSVVCPPPQPMPERLERLVPYEPLC
jgi:hypothetical protein